MITPVRFVWFSTVILVASCCGTSMAGDWPQILGPNRNGVAENETLAKAWPKEGPAVNWKVDLGDGYAGPVVVGDRVVIHHRVKSTNLVEAISAKTGEKLWSTQYDATYRGGIDADLGPRATPIVDGDSIFVLSAAGELHHLALKDGRKIWSKDLHTIFGGREGYFGYGGTPIVVGELILLNIGGEDGGGIVALNKADGSTKWKTGEDAASYSSPIAATIGGKSRVIFVTRLRVVALEPKTGKEAFSFAFGKRGPTVNAAAPLLFGDKLFVTASYNIGGKLVSVTADKVTDVWASDESLSSQYPTPVTHNGYLYGVHGRDDIGEPEFRCVDTATGKVVRTHKGYGVVHCILVGDEILALNTTGELIRLKATPKEHIETARIKLADTTTRAIPALANGRFYFRTTSRNGSSQLICLTVGQ